MTYIRTNAMLWQQAGMVTSRETPSAGRGGGWTPEAEAFFSLSEASPCKMETHRSAKIGQGAAASWTPGRVYTRVQERAMRAHSDGALGWPGGVTDTRGPLPRPRPSPRARALCPRPQTSPQRRSISFLLAPTETGWTEAQAVAARAQRRRRRGLMLVAPPRAQRARETQRFGRQRPSHFSPLEKRSRTRG